MFKEANPAENLIKREKKILSFWQKNKVFEKLMKKNLAHQNWSFLDGPITANNPMGIHHAWGRTYKDLFQRYKAMRGFKERFQNGFDCQGLWVEVEVEKELGFKTKKDIEKYGIENFVNKCKERVLKYSKVQTRESIRLGQWMDFKNSYYTMSEENNYAIWHFLKKCHQKGYLYKGRDSVPWCPRCSTAISQHEILTEEYQEIVHEAVYFKLPILDVKFKNTSFLVWTTTPWTIPANVALAVNPKLVYGLYQGKKEALILLCEIATKILPPDFKLIKKIPGKELIGLKYQGPFDNLERAKEACKENPKTFHSVITAKDLVVAGEGTGIVHIAPGAGTEDFKLGQDNKLPVIVVIDEEAFYLEKMGKFSRKNAKKHPEIIFDYLKKYQAGKFFYKTEKYQHRYPVCWRCKTELVWRVVDEWYIKMDDLRKPMMAVAKKINWLPSFGLERELDWLKNMQDWLISKKRYWGLALPIYECKCGNFEVIGGREELKKRAIEGWEKFEGKSPHRPWVDKVKIQCPKCNGIISRIPDVGNPWLDAGIAPFSTMKYFEDRAFFKKWFPPDFICESFPGQFKNWFYSLIAMSTVLENTNSFKTILGYASVRDEKGEEMHKSKGNVIWFDEAVERIGADILRWMFLRTDPFDNLNFSYRSAEEVRRRFILILKNVYHFFVTYANIDGWEIRKLKVKDVLDKWVIFKLNLLIKKVTQDLEKFHPQQAALGIESFVIEDFSTWYLRRTRKRRDSEFYSVMYECLLTLTKLLAPFVPFLAEDIYQNLRQKETPGSVHLCDWPKEGKTDEALIRQMGFVRKIVEIGHALRAEEGIRLRQPLSKIVVSGQKYLDDNLKHVILEELNISEFKQVEHNQIPSKNQGFTCLKKGGIIVCLNVNLTQELIEEGILRDFIRHIQMIRKEKEYTPKDYISTFWNTDDKELLDILERNEERIKKLTKSTRFLKIKETKGREIKIDGRKIRISLQK